MSWGEIPNSIFQYKNSYLERMWERGPQWSRFRGPSVGGCARWSGEGGDSSVPPSRVLGVFPFIFRFRIDTLHCTFSIHSNLSDKFSDELFLTSVGGANRYLMKSSHLNEIVEDKYCVVVLARFLRGGVNFLNCHYNNSNVEKLSRKY